MPTKLYSLLTILTRRVHEKFYSIINYIFFPLIAASNTYDTKTYKVIIEVKAQRFADLHDYTNEYKLNLKLIEKKSMNNGSTLGIFKISDSKNSFTNFSSKNPLSLGESFKRVTKVILPTTVLEKTMLKISVSEEDFTIPVPGPCCLYINNNDTEVSENIDLSSPEGEYEFIGETAQVKVRIVLINETKEKLNTVVDEQFKYLYNERGFNLTPTYRELLLGHIIKNI